MNLAKKDKFTFLIVENENEKTMKLLLPLIGLVLLYLMLKKKAVPAMDLPLETYSGKIEEYQGQKDLLVVFYAHWSAVWRLTSQVLKDVDLNVYDLKIINAEENVELISQYEIKILPSVLVFSKGDLVNTVANLSSLNQIKTQ